MSNEDLVIDTILRINNGKVLAASLTVQIMPSQTKSVSVLEALSTGADLLVGPVKRMLGHQPLIEIVSFPLMPERFLDVKGDYGWWIGVNGRLLMGPRVNAETIMLRANDIFQLSLADGSEGTIV